MGMPATKFFKQGGYRLAKSDICLRDTSWLTQQASFCVTGVMLGADESKYVRYFM